MVPLLGTPPTPLVLCLQSLSWTCSATTRSDPNLQINFPAWPWTCLLAMDLLAWLVCTLGLACPPALHLPFSLAVGCALPGHRMFSPSAAGGSHPSLLPDSQLLSSSSSSCAFTVLHREGINSAGSWKWRMEPPITSKTRDSTCSRKITWMQGSFNCIVHYLKACMNHNTLSLQSDTKCCCLPFKRNRKNFELKCSTLIKSWKLQF